MQRMVQIVTAASSRRGRLLWFTPEMMQADDRRQPALTLSCDIGSRKAGSVWVVDFARTRSTLVACRHGYPKTQLIEGSAAIWQGSRLQNKANSAHRILSFTSR